MKDLNGISRVRQSHFYIIFKIILIFIASLSFVCFSSNNLFAQDGYDIYYYSEEQWIIMAYTEYKTATGKYEVYLQVMDAGGNNIPYQDIKGLDANPYFMADNGKSPMVSLAFDSGIGTAYVVYETESGLTPPVKIVDIVFLEQTYGLSGTVRTSGGVAISGAIISLSGASNDTSMTDINGNYSFTGLANGAYTVTPSKTGYTFTPTGRNVTISGANATGQDFTGAVAGSYSISGTVKPIVGVTMTLSGTASGSTTPDSQGRYTFTGLANGSYTVTPGMTGYKFKPTSRTVNISGANVTGQNFTGNP